MTMRNFMRRLPAVGGLIGVLGASLSGCGGGGGGPAPLPIGDPPAPSATGDFTGRAACVANPTRGGKKWTVLVFMNAANNLQPDSLTNIAQMAQVGSDNNLNIVVQWKQATCADCGTPSFLGTRRYLIRQHSDTERGRILAGDTTVLDADRLPDPTTNVGGTSDMGDWRVLQDFLKWGTQTFPADHLAVVMWDHGSGWRPTRSAKTRAFSQDDQSNNEIQTEEIPGALAGLTQPIDALIFDCSLMQMIEVAYEVRNTARILVGSEESPPGAGYPYHQWLTALKTAGTTPCAVGKTIVDKFLEAYTQHANITQSVIDLSQMNNLALRLNSFATALRQNISNQATVIENARNAAQSYDYPDNKDLFHFANLIRTTTTVPTLKQAATDLQNALTNKGAIMLSKHGQFSQANSNGLAVYVPRAGNYLQSYNGLALSRATTWDDFLKSQVR